MLLKDLLKIEYNRYLTELLMMYNPIGAGEQPKQNVILRKGADSEQAAHILQQYSDLREKTEEKRPR